MKNSVKKTLDSIYEEKTYFPVIWNTNPMFLGSGAEFKETDYLQRPAPAINGDIWFYGNNAAVYINGKWEKLDHTNNKETVI